MLRLDRAARGPLPAAVVRKLAAQVGRLGRGAGAVLASDYGSGVAGPEVIEALQRVHRAGVPVCVDSRYALVRFKGLTMVKPNEVGAGGGQRPLAGRPRRPGAGRPRAAPQGGAARCCWSPAAATACRSSAPGSHRSTWPAHGSQDAVDVTGAGDTVAAAFAAGLAAGGDALAAARLANVAGALQVLKPGTATVSRAELDAELRRA